MQCVLDAPWRLRYVQITGMLHGNSGNDMAACRKHRSGAWLVQKHRFLRTRHVCRPAISDISSWHSSHSCDNWLWYRAIHQALEDGANARQGLSPCRTRILRWTCHAHGLNGACIMTQRQTKALLSGSSLPSVAGTMQQPQGGNIIS